ncbi:MAG: putative hydrolase [Frankiales bacterium]|nr:putative hydrolase [Frankiales bacterium]
MTARDPLEDLRRIVFLLDRRREPEYRAKAFLGAARTVQQRGPAEIAARAAAGTLQELPGIGKATAAVIVESLRGEVPGYLAKLEPGSDAPLATGGEALRAALRGDCHVHSDWSDGGATIEEMARTAIALGHSYIVLTDHSPRLTVARGLTRERLLEQLDVVARLNDELAPFRLLTGIECDILLDGSLDQDPDLLERLDLVVGSVHSKLRMPGEEMTPRMVAAVSNPLLDVLGHCTGRLVTGRGRPESEFEAEIVFEACRTFGVAVEINSRPERLDPPMRLLRLAVEMGCTFSIDTDAHATGQLDWQQYGCARAQEAGVTAERVVNTRTAEELLGWTAARR